MLIHFAKLIQQGCPMKSYHYHNLHRWVLLPHAGQFGSLGLWGRRGAVTGPQKVAHEHLTSLVRVSCLKMHIFAYTMAPTQKTILHLVLNHRIAICSNARETTGCVGLVRSTMSVSIMMCKYCVLDFIVD